MARMPLLPSMPVPTRLWPVRQYSARMTTRPRSPGFATANCPRWLWRDDRLSDDGKPDFRQRKDAGAKCCRMAPRARPGGRPPRSTPRRLYQQRNTDHGIAFSVASRLSVLGRRAVRSAERSPQQLSDGAGRFALPGPDSRWQYSPDPDRGPVGGGGRRVHGNIEEVLGRRRACVGPAVVRGDAAWDRRKWTHRLIVPRTPGVAGEAAVASRRSARTPGL